MVLAILRGQKADGYVLGTKTQSPQSLKSNGEAGSSTSIINPVFEEWTATDQALLRWFTWFDDSICGIRGR